MSDLAVLFGGPSPEHDVSILTGLQVVRTLVGSSSAGHGAVVAVYWSKAGEMFEVDGSLEAEAFLGGPPRGAVPVRLVVGPGGGFEKAAGLRARHRPLEVGVVVNCCHGGPGEDGSLQAALDLAGIPYTGPSAAGAALGMDKLAFGALMSSAGIASLGRFAVGSGGDLGIEGPLIVKPRFGGSSIGIEVVADRATAEALARARPELREGAVAEPYREDLYDLQIAIRSWPRLELSAVERPLRSTETAGILGYSDKYVGGEGMASAPRELPAAIPTRLESELREVARRVADLVGLRGVARIDFLSDGRELYVNEINTIPGSLTKHLWVRPPVSFESLLADLVEEAARRPSRHYTSAGADGSALRSAGSISSKLG